MLIKTIIDHQEGRKWEIYKEEDNKHFRYIYYEFFRQIGWRKTSEGKNYTEDDLEWRLGIIL